MKKYLILILFITLGVFACKKDNKTTDPDFEKSYQAWLSFKKSSNNSYSYIVLRGSVVSNITTETTLTVTNGAITARDYVAYSLAPNPSSSTVPAKIIRDQWHEGKAELNSHTNSAAQLLTLDQVYQKAKAEWINVDRSKNNTYYAYTNNGMISNVGYSAKGCVDDCTIGIIILEIKAL